MRKNIAMERASLLKKAAEKAGPLFVIASPDTAYDPKSELAGYACSHCGVQFAVTAGIEPYCTNCGTDSVTANEEFQDVELPATDETMCYSTCKECGTHNQTTVATAKHLGGLMHCAACGTEMKYQMASDDGEPMLLDHADSDEIKDLEKATQQQTAGDVTDSMDDTEETQVDKADESDVTQTLPNKTEADAGEVDDLDGLEPVDMGDTDNTDLHTDETPAVAKVVVATIDTTPNGDLMLARIGDSTLAFAGRVHVATLLDDKVSAEVATMELSTLEGALNHSAQSMGRKAALAHYGFDLAKVAIVRDKAVTAAVAQQSKDAKEALAREAASLQTKFMQCMSLAAVAINKGFVPHHTNVLKTQLAETLEAAGVQNPRKLIDTVFASAGDVYHKSLLTVANEYMSKSEEARNEIAELVKQGRYQSSDNETATTDESGDNTVLSSVLPFKPSSATAEVARAKSKTVIGQIRGTFSASA